MSKMTLLCEKLSPEELLRDFFEDGGFTFKGCFDDIVCCMCGFETKGTLTIDHIQFMHKILNPKCEMIRYLPYNYHNILKAKLCIYDYASAKKCISETEEIMRSTFRSWPKRLPSIDKLVDAGFFYTGVGDDLMCVECKIVLHDWEKTDDPWIEHEKASPNCLLVKLYR